LNTLPQALITTLDSWEVPYESSMFERWTEYEDALYRVNETTNLTRVRREEAWARHLLDSLTVVPLIPEGAHVLDLGSGPGFPGFAIALFRPDVTVTCVDSAGKMIGFLKEQALPNLHAHQIRIEEWDSREEFDFVTGRALAPLPVQLELSAHLCRKGGMIVPLRTPNDVLWQDAFAQLGIELRESRTIQVPSGDGAEVLRLLPVYAKIKSTPAKFPRTWVQMKSKPLGG
jgi:16S rRNA (guanine527-N7)-methyltransferase